MYSLLFNQHYQLSSNQKLPSWANAVFQHDGGVCGQAFPSLPSSSPVIAFFCCRPNFLDELARKRLLRRLLFCRELGQLVACVASVSVRFRSKERGKRVKDRAKNGPSLSFFGSCLISRAAKTENPVPRSFFTPKPNGNACYEGYTTRDFLARPILPGNRS